jgi:hypothetical protein
MTEVPESDPPPSAKRGNLVAKLNAYRNIILAVAALATAIGSWFRPTDTTATKNSFDWTSKKIEELSENEVKTHEDIVALRGYLDGYVKGQEPDQPSVGSIGTIGHKAGTGSGFGAGGARRVRKPIAVEAAPANMSAPPPAAIAAPVAEAAAAPPAILAEPQQLPELRANPSFVRHPKFEDVAFDVKK